MTLLSVALAFDLGASSGRALIGELTDECGRQQLRVTEIHRFPNRPVQVGRHLHWDILQLLQEVKGGIRKAFQQGYAVESFGIDTWGVDFGLLDANGELLGNPYHYRDPHTDGLIAEIGALIGKGELYEQGGLQSMPFNTIYQLYAMKKADSPQLQAAQTLLLTPDLLVYFLTGCKVCEFTMATTTQLYMPLEQVWNTRLMERLDIPARIFLEPSLPGTLVGPLADDVCLELNVPKIDAVAVGTHDTESAVVAVPAPPGPFAYLVCGTWSLLGTELDTPIISEEARELEFSNEGGVGGTYQLLKNIMGLWILQECKREWDERDETVSFQELAEEARSAAPFRSMIDPDDARFYGPGGMPGKIQSYCRETNQPVPESKGEHARCILESLALRYRQALDQTERLAGQRFDGLHMVGGGIQNELLCRFTACALGRPVWSGPVEASAIGNLLVQFIAKGKCADLQHARRLVAASFPIDTYEPLDDRAEWDFAYRRFIALTGTP
ncbi:carbohydrate kinase [Paenibacillus darwinianus]|uniref:Carbohydrate kinase n=1 Tax=Paenibacillus darwinianus TaxID=1380763 RepID=A0A9W5S2H1_9BACL|nr:rhamnulokinase family protein [Paenibacillus darwinianus]EXX89160.1 carbohydrate kinase [Paenibacillus darwinianus]EXX89549.1 carbohydrate kinase [Paenibacillus darwinianus]EXX89750.1 carbohydrate kinase [Paenibacillus darwinianus]